MAETPKSSAPPSDNQSRPQYGVLRPIPTARENLVAAEGSGIQSVLRMFGEASEGFADRSQVLYAETGAPAVHELDVLRAYGTKGIDVVPDADEALRYLERLLDSATMETRLYAAGSERFVGQVVQTAINHGVHHNSIVTELSGSLARRVRCVHCRHITDDVKVTIFECPGCGNTLGVYDHYSRRLAAYLGVSATAEDPSEQLGDEAEEAYS